MKLPRSTILAICVLAACDDRLPPQVPSFPQPQSPVTPTPVVPAQPPASVGDPINGVYTLTLEVGSTCDIIPQSAKRRTYEATISAVAEEKYIVTLTEGQFLSGRICDLGLGVGCNQFYASRESEVMHIDLRNDNDFAHGGHITEQLSDATWISIIGEATGLFRGSTLSATGTSSVWYCPTPRSYPFPCEAFTGCEADMRLTFVRR